MNGYDLDSTLCQLSGSPLAKWYLEECRTDDQRRWWDFTRFFYQTLYNEFKAYQLGEQITAPPGDEQFLENMKRIKHKYLALYSLLQESWEQIKPKVLEDIRIDLFQKQINKACIPFLVETPGEVIITIFLLECRALFEDCLSYSEFSPRSIHSLSKEQLNVEYLAKNPPIPQKITCANTPENLAKLDQYNNHLEELRGKYPSGYFPDLEQKRLFKELRSLLQTGASKEEIEAFDRSTKLISAYNSKLKKQKLIDPSSASFFRHLCEASLEQYASRSKKGAIVRELWAQYKRWGAELGLEVTKLCHPQRQAKPHTWIGGRLNLS